MKNLRLDYQEVSIIEAMEHFKYMQTNFLTHSEAVAEVVVHNEAAVNNIADSNKKNVQNSTESFNDVESINYLIHETSTNNIINLGQVEIDES